MSKNMEQIVKAEYIETLLGEMSFNMQQLEESMERVARTIESCDASVDTKVIWDTIVDLQMSKSNVNDMKLKQSEVVSLLLK